MADPLLAQIRDRPAPVRRPRTRPRRRVLPATPTTRHHRRALTNHRHHRDHHDADADTPRRSHHTDARVVPSSWRATPRRFRNLPGAWSPRGVAHLCVVRPASPHLDNRSIDLCIRRRCRRNGRPRRGHGPCHQFGIAVGDSRSSHTSSLHDSSTGFGGPCLDLRQIRPNWTETGGGRQQDRRKSRAVGICAVGHGPGDMLAARNRGFIALSQGRGQPSRVDCHEYDEDWEGEQGSGQPYGLGGTFRRRAPIPRSSMYSTILFGSGLAGGTL